MKYLGLAKSEAAPLLNHGKPERLLVFAGEIFFPGCLGWCRIVYPQYGYDSPWANSQIAEVFPWFPFLHRRIRGTVSPKKTHSKLEWSKSFGQHPDVFGGIVNSFESRGGLPILSRNIKTPGFQAAIGF